MNNLQGDCEKPNKKESLAREIMNLSRNTLLVNLRFLDVALSRLELVCVENSRIWTDGQHIYYDPMHVLRSYKAEKEIPVRDYLHMVLHCVFCHMFTSPKVDRQLWNLACDMAVENIISQLHLRALAAGREREQEAVLEAISKELDLLTAEKLYAYLQKKFAGNGDGSNAADEICLEQLAALFLADDHQSWFPAEDFPEKTEEDSDDGGQGEASDSLDQAAEDEGEHPQVENPLAEEWRELAEKLQTDLETFSKEQGDRAGALMQNLKEINREKADYESFLRKFSTLGEIMKINDDEFDYVFYTYGLQLYKNMPLVEPLEYKEVKRIKEFVVAIDTSGSTSGEMVQKFVEKTYSILSSTENFFSKINLHIIQCDAEIQEHRKITSMEELEAYIKTMAIRGQGGTDFRPVFQTVDRLIAQKEFTNLKGLIYFTDGYGTFPAVMPEYKTAFVFLSDSYDSPQVPAWAIKLVLQKDEI